MNDNTTNGPTWALAILKTIWRHMHQLWKMYTSDEHSPLTDPKVRQSYIDKITQIQEQHKQAMLIIFDSIFKMVFSSSSFTLSLSFYIRFGDIIEEGFFDFRYKTTSTEMKIKNDCYYPNRPWRHVSVKKSTRGCYTNRMD